MHPASAQMMVPPGLALGGERDSRGNTSHGNAFSGHRILPLNRLSKFRGVEGPFDLSLVTQLASVKVEIRTQASGLLFSLQGRQTSSTSLCLCTCVLTVFANSTNKLAQGVPMPAITDGASQEAVSKQREQTIDPRRGFSMDSSNDTVKCVKRAKKKVTILHGIFMLIYPQSDQGFFSSVI